jgi:beta-N-acetylhexosaminidase
MFDAPGACGRVLASGTDLIMICSHWTGTDRAYAMLEDLERDRAAGVISEDVLAASAARIDALLAAAPTHAPRLLDAEVLARHAGIAPLRTAAGAAGQTVSLAESPERGS